MNELTQFRDAKNEFFKADPQSPLTGKQKRKFNGLVYFPENPQLRFVCDVEEFPEKTEIIMQTSTGDTQDYLRFGKISFKIDGRSATLTVYASEDGFFLPFVDGLAGSETYAAGRYLDPSPDGEGRLFVDFNYAYNPYCAYNEHWSCPIPPKENRLSLPIRAGEKIFTSH